MAELKVETHTRAGVTTICLDGELDSYSAQQLSNLLEPNLGASQPAVLIDLTAVEYIDSVGLGVLVAALKQVTDKSGLLGLISPSQAVARVLHITGLDKVFVIYTDTEDAWRQIDAGAQPLPVERKIANS